MQNLEKLQNLLKNELPNVGRDLGNVELQKNNSKKKTNQITDLAVEGEIGLKHLLRQEQNS